MTTHRLYAAGPLSLGVTFALFLVMQALVGNRDELILDDEAPFRFIDFVQVDEAIEPTRMIREPVKPPEVEIPDPVEAQPVEASNPNKINTGVPLQKVNNGVDLDGFNLGADADGEYMPLVRVTATYPNRAAERGIEGYVVVELTVAADGSVPADSIFVIDAEPKGYFEREAIKAARKFKYKPKVVNGVAQPVSGVQYRFSFNLAD